MTKNKKILIYTCFVLLIGSLSVSIYFLLSNDPVSTQAQVSNNSELITFTLAELQSYDGTNPELPIYIAYHGNVYDVTAGKKFYEVGGSYHYLAGKDSTEDLDIAGGSIIKRKYPVIGVLEETEN